MGTNRTAEEKRRFNRILFDTEITLSADEGHWVSRLVDLSLNGALIILPPDWALQRGSAVNLSIHLHNDVVIRMSCEVAHVSDDVIGLRCGHIDVDSAAHLRRLVELNLGNMELLDRDLASLVH